MNERDIIVNMWDMLREYIPAKEKQTAADHLVQAVIDYDLPDHDFKAITSSCEFLEEAAKEFVEEDEEELDWED